MTNHDWISKYPCFRKRIIKTNTVYFCLVCPVQQKSPDLRFSMQLCKDVSNGKWLVSVCMQFFFIKSTPETSSALFLWIFGTAYIYFLNYVSVLYYYLMVILTFFRPNSWQSITYYQLRWFSLWTIYVVTNVQSRNQTAQIRIHSIILLDSKKMQMYKIHLLGFGARLFKSLIIAMHVWCALQ